MSNDLNENDIESLHGYAKEFFKKCPEKYKNILFELYMNQLVPRAVLECVETVAQKDENFLQKLVPLLKNYTEFSTQWRNNADYCIASRIKEVASDDKNSLEKVIDAFSKYYGFISRFKSGAGGVAICIGYLAWRKEEKLGTVINFLNEYGDDLATGAVAECIKAVIKKDEKYLEDTFEILKKCKNYHGEVDRAVAWVLSDIAWENEEYIGSVVKGLKDILSERPEAYRNHQKEVLKGKMPRIQDAFFKYNKSHIIPDTTGEVIEMSVREKSLDMDKMPTDEEYGYQIFNSHAIADERLVRNILNPAVQLLEFKINDKSAMAIVAATKNEKAENVLLFDSLNSKSEVFARKKVAETLLEELKKYAKDAGFNKVAISRNVANRSEDFYEKIEGNESEISLELHIKVPKPYLETDLSKDKGKVFDLGATKA